MGKKVSDLQEIFEMAPGEWVWCLHCERAYQVGEFRSVGGFQLCPYEDCDGGPLDAWRWSDLVGKNGYPVEPERGAVYALYPETDGRKSPL